MLFGLFRGYGVVPATAPRVTAHNPPYAHQAAFDGTVCLHRLDEVGGARWGKAAAGVGTRQQMKRFADKFFVKFYRQDD